MVPLHPEHVSEARIDGDVLGVIRFGQTTALNGFLNIAARPLGDRSVEVWRSQTPIVRGSRDALSFAQNGSVMFGAIVSSEDEIETATRRAYETIVAATREEGFPFLLRVWNHVRDINSGEGELEQYKRFCAGRHEALTSAGFSKCQFPSASAVGMRDGQLAIYFIASRTAGRQIENPRQMSAYEYPREYGRRSPSFARATLADLGGGSALFVSGTASVVGHQTCHAGDAREQTVETIRNLSAILGEARASAHDVCTMKLYVRRGQAAGEIDGRMRDAFPSASILVLDADICRRDLLLEVEAVAIRKS